MAYCTRQDLDDVFGRLNIDAWADLDNEKVGTLKWVAGTEYVAGSSVRPSEVNGFRYTTELGGKSGAKEPDWPVVAGDDVTDGGVTWVAVEDAAEARTMRAIASATAEIDDTLRDGPYVVPLEPNGEEYPQTLVDLCASLAGVWLYEARGVQDFDEATGAPTHRQGWRRDYARRVMKRLLAGTLVIDCTKVCDTDAPQAVKAEEDA